MTGDRRYVWLALATGAAAIAVIPAAHGTSWHYFDDAAQLLLGRAPGVLGPGGLHLFHSHPEFQFGPLALVAAVGLRLACGSHAALVAQLLLLPLPLVLTWLLEDAAVRLGADARTRRIALLGGVSLIGSWLWLVLFTTHIDDALALSALVLACNLISRGRPMPAALAIGLAAAAKPWAIVFVPLTLVLPVRRRTALALALGLGVVGWIPFLVADHGTFAALGRFTIENSPVSGLRALEIDTANTPPWDRALQTIAGLAVVIFTVSRRDRWAGALLAGLGIRLALDPGTHHYYTAGLVVAGLAWDLLVSPYDWPLASWTALALLEIPRTILPGDLAGITRLAVTLGAVVLATLGPVRDGRRCPVETQPITERNIA
ncbi:MAG: hypothetical protein JO291_16525 [Acidimicrobiia bacterium]|nr:hypothetical protein [Acidimicrobiia bacterium]